jgi:hypothetical protein
MKLALPAVAVMLASAVAFADPHVDAARCTSLDAREVDVAVTRELALAPRLAARARQLTISLECPDGLHATVHLDPGAVSRELDLDDEPAELRVKLTALAIVELIDMFDAVAAAAPPSPARDDETPPRFGAAKKKAPGPAIAFRAGVRLFADDTYPMATFAADLELGPIQVGLSSALGEGHRFTGVPYIVAATVARRLICSLGTTSVCFVFRGQAGIAGVSIYDDSMALMEHSVHSAYADLTVGLELQRRFGVFKGLASLELGAADGLVVEAQSFVHLDGPFALTGIGVQW